MVVFHWKICLVKIHKVWLCLTLNLCYIHSLFTSCPQYSFLKDLRVLRAWVYKTAEWLINITSSSMNFHVSGCKNIKKHSLWWFWPLGIWTHFQDFKHSFIYKLCTLEKPVVVSKYLFGSVSAMDTVAMILMDLTLTFLWYYRKTTPGTSAGISHFPKLRPRSTRHNL